MVGWRYFAHDLALDTQPSLRSMDDFDGPIVAKTIYEELFHPGAETLDPKTIPYALDSAVRKLRASGLVASRWAPYVHLGV